MTNKEDFINAGFEVIDSNEKPNQLLEFLKKHYPQTIKDGELKINELKNALEIPIDEKNNGYGLNFIGRNFAKAKYTLKTTKELKINQNLSKNFDETQNAIIKGDNLDSLKILLNSYRGKIKCIYIDPPYNTKNEGFIYPDKFDKEEVEALGFENIGEDDYRRMEFSFNSKSSHNGWLSFMYPRLKLARDLLTDDGVIFISIDDNEQANLRILMDEIFGEENSLDRGKIIWVNKGSTKGFTKIIKNHEYITSYSKNSDLVKSVFYQNFKELDEVIDERLYIKQTDKNPVCEIIFKKGLKIEGVSDIEFQDYVGGDNNKLEILSNNQKMTFIDGELSKDVILRGSYPSKNQLENFLKGEEVFDCKGQKWLEVYFTSSGLPYHKKERNTKIISSILDDCGNSGYTDLKNLEIPFDNAKPVKLLKKILSFFTTKNDLILDFFAGSGTTAQAVMELNKEDGGNRKFILCQIDEPIDEKKKKEAFDFCLKNNLPPAISSITIERVRRVGEKILKEIEQENAKKQPDLLNLENTKNNATANLDIGFKCFDLIETSKIVENDNQLTLQLSENDSLSKIYHLILKDGVFDLNAKIETIIENCLYLVENQTYFIINAIKLENEENKKILSKILEDKNKNFKIDGFTASINLTMQQYQDRSRFKIIY